MNWIETRVRGEAAARLKGNDYKMVDPALSNVWETVFHVWVLASGQDRAVGGT